MLGLPDFAQFVDLGNGAGTITAHPLPGDRGNYVLTVRAADTGGGDPKDVLLGESVFVLSATSDNEPPILSPIGDKVALFDRELTFEVRAADADEDPLTFRRKDCRTGRGSSRPACTALPGSNGHRVQWMRAPHTFTLHVADSGNGDPGRQLDDVATVNVVVRGPTRRRNWRRSAR